MRLSILAIGKMKKGPETDLLARYLERAQKTGAQLGISGPDLTEWSESRETQVGKRKEQEAKLILGAKNQSGLMIALDENGKDFSSQDLAKYLDEKRNNAIPEIAFVLGGPDGHGPHILNTADLKLRMGRMTWPHQLARVMIAEQIYRAITILNGHPYHRV